MDKHVSSFYVTGGTLPLNSDSYVTRQADTDLLEGLQRGEFCYVLNTRQMGKSSLMVRTAHHLRTLGCRIIVLDLTAIGQNLTIEQWYSGLVGRIAQQTDREDELLDFWETQATLGPMQRFVETLRRVLLTACASAAHGATTDTMNDDKLVLFIDEIDSVRSLPFSADEFFAGIRECYNRRASEPAFNALTFCLLGVATPSDLIRDTRVTPFNVGRRIELHDFTRAEAAPLAAGLAVHRSEMEAELLLERVLHWTGGHPYMTQRLCRAVAESLATQSANPNIASDGSGTASGGGKRDEIEDVALVDGLCKRLFLTRTAQETDDNLAFARTRLLHSEADRAALLDMYAQVRRGRRVRDDETNPLCPVLRLSGVVKASGGWLTLRNLIYTHVFDGAWIAEHMPDAEVRRQKRAYRLGILRTATVSAIVLLIMAGLAGYAWQQSKYAWQQSKTAQAARAQAQAEAERSNRLLYATRMNLLQRAYQEDDIARARDLLAETAPSPYRGFEWNYWNRLLKRERLALPMTEPQSLAVWSRDGRWIITQSRSTLQTPQLSLWDAHTGNLIRTFAGRADALPGVTSPVAAHCVALVDAPVGKTGTVRLVNPETGETRHILPVRATGATLAGDGGRVFTLEPQPGARTLFKAWDVERGTLLLTTMVSGTQVFGTLYQTPTVQSTPDSRLLCLGSAYVRENCAFTLLDTTNGKRLWTPPGKYNRYAFSPTGRFLVATTQDGHAAGRFEVWDLQTRWRIAMLRGRKPEGSPSLASNAYLLFMLHFSPNERWIAGAGEDEKFNGSVWLWDTTTGKETRVLSARRRVLMAQFTADGRNLISMAQDNSLRVWNTATWKAAGAYSNDNTNPPVPSPNGKEFLTADHSSVLVYSLEASSLPESKELIQTPATPWLYIHFHPDGRHLRLIRAPWSKPGLSDNIGTQYVYDLQTGERRTLSFDQSPKPVVFGDGAQAVGLRSTPAGGTWFETRDVLTGRLVSRLHDPLPYWWVRSDGPGLAEIVYDGKVPVKNLTPSTLAERHLQVVLWNAQTGKEVARLAHLSYIPWQVTPRCGTRKLVIVDTENVAHIWNTSPLREVFHVSLGAMTQVREGNFSVSPDGKYISVLVAQSHFDGRIEVYESDTGMLCAQNDHAYSFQPEKAFSPDGKYRIWADVQQNVHLMETATNKEARLLKSVGGNFLCAAFSPDGSRLATGANTGIIKLWDVATGAELMLFRQAGEVDALSFSPEGTRLGCTAATTKQGHAFIWEAPVPVAVLTQR